MQYFLANYIKNLARYVLCLIPRCTAPHIARNTSLLLLAFTALVVTNSHAADINAVVRSPQITTTSPTARYEIIQSTISARATFRIDRYTGRIWELVLMKDDTTGWQETRVQERPQIQTPNRPRFQLFTSGLAVRHTFLLDGETGKTWLFVTATAKERDATEYEYRMWEPFAE